MFNIAAVCNVLCRIVDENDNEPRFERSAIELSVSEQVGVGEPVGEVVASDRDEGENAELTYALLPLCRPGAASASGSGSCAGDASAHFSIEPATGRISARTTCALLFFSLHFSIAINSQTRSLVFRC